MLCQQSSFGVEESCLSITNYYIQELRECLQLLGYYSCLTRFACSRSTTRSVHLLCNARESLQVWPSPFLFFFFFFFFFKVGPGDEATYSDGFLALPRSVGWGSDHLHKSCWGQACLEHRVHNSSPIFKIALNAALLIHCATCITHQNTEETVSFPCIWCKFGYGVCIASTISNYCVLCQL